ncbi:phage major capsid protein [Microcystis sp. M061S2]|uniref:phage major capsid protein n=1 Tax=Microcystis sp. M061S2 TaxID=2771171 RepID=UPI002583D58F|nr:phage major capsid protein [Microcystis sp. M061S2]MCA2656867.1 phage major capsid protein [Microcystis sp. M061S2]
MGNQFSSIQSNLAQLKNFYQGPIVSQFNDEIPVYRGSEKIKNAYTGQQVIRPLKVRRNPGIGATSDGGILPAIGRQTTVQAIIAAKYNYLRFGVTGPMIKASQNDTGAFVRAAAYELEEGYKDLKSDVNRQLSWDGSGWLARVSANAVATPVITIAGREAVEAPDKFLDVGLTVDIVTTAGTVVASAVDILSITGTGSTRTVTLSGPVTAAAGTYLIRTGSAGQEINGLLTQLDGLTTTVFNVDRSLFPSARGNVVDLGAGQLTLDAMQQAWNLGLQRGGAKYSAIFTDFDSLRYYQKLLTADKRYSNTVKGDGGFAAKDQFYLDFNGIPVVPDKDCPQRMFFLPWDAFKAYMLAELEFADETGSMYIAQVAADQLEVRVRLFMNLFNEKASASAALRNYLSP